MKKTMLKIKDNKFADRLKNSKVDAADAEGMSSMSPSFLLSADKLFELGKKEIEKRGKVQMNDPEYFMNDHSVYFHSGIILYCTGFDAFMNEQLSLSHIFAIKREEGKNMGELRKYIEGLLYDNDNKKIRKFYYSYNQNKEALNEKIEYSIRRLDALFGIRNELVHYTAEFVRHRDCPKRAINAYNFIKKEYPFNIDKQRVNHCIDWISFFGCLPAINWAKETVKNGLMLFAEITDGYFHIEHTYHKFLDIELNEEFYVRHDIKYQGLEN